MKNISGARKRRVGFIDELRGLDIITMAVYHAMYDLVFIFGVHIAMFGFWMRWIQPVIAGVFIVLSGISCQYSKSNLKRGIKAFALGMLLTVITLLFIREEAIYFGILHFMGVSMMLFALVNPLLDRVPGHIGATLSSILFLFTYHLPRGYVGINGLFTFALPASLYTHKYLMPLGFFGVGSDYFPLIPWFFLYVAGSYIGMFFVNDRVPDWFYRNHCRPLCAAGRHTIVIYMLHQPVIMGILYLIFR